MEITELFAYIKAPMTIVHVVAVVFGMGSALTSDLLFNFYSDNRSLSRGELATLKFLSNMVWVGLIVIAISGIGLFLSDMPKYIHSVKFISKMSILGVLVANGYVLHHYIWKHVAKRGFLISRKESGMRKWAFACGAVSVLSWIAVCALGVLDSVPVSYGAIMTGYSAVVIGGIAVALAVEYRTLERIQK